MGPQIKSKMRTRLETLDPGGALDRGDRGGLHRRPGGFDGSPGSIEELRGNIARAGVISSLIANDYCSSMIDIPLLPMVTTVRFNGGMNRRKAWLTRVSGR